MTPLALLLLKLAAIALPLGLLARLARVYPRAPLVWLALIPAATTLAAPLWPPVVWAALSLDAAIAAIALGDALTLPGRKAFSVERTAGRIVSLRKPHAVTLVLANRARRWHDVAVRDGVPHELNPEPAQFSLRAAAQSRAVLRYALRPSRRGAFRADRVHLRARSRLGLWQRLLECPAGSVFHVYPDMKQLGQYALLARTNRLSLMGVRRTRRVGHDNEFERLRDYTIDDNYKHINWRRHRPPLETHRPGIPVQPQPAADVPRGLRTDDDQPGGRPQPPRPRLQRRAHAQLCRLAARRFRGPDLLLRRNPRLHPAARRHEADEPPAARLVRPLSPAGRIALRPGVSLPRVALPQAVAGRAGDEHHRRGERRPGAART